jgi:hypothetical protein
MFVILSFHLARCKYETELKCWENNILLKQRQEYSHVKQFPCPNEQ